MHTEQATARDERSLPARAVGTVRALLGTALAIAATTAVAIALTETTFALWVSGETVTPGVVQTGTASLDVDSSFTPSAWSNLLVGESVRQPITISNTGNVPLALTASGTSSSAFYELRVAAGSCPAVALSGASLAASTPALGTLAAGATMTGCLEVRLVAGAAPGSTASIAVTVSGVQAS